MQELHPVAQSH